MKISQMPQSTTPSSDDVLAMLEGGTANKKITLGDVGDWVNKEHTVSNLETESKTVAGAINEIGTEVTELKNGLDENVSELKSALTNTNEKYHFTESNIVGNKYWEFYPYTELSNRSSAAVSEDIAHTFYSKKATKITQPNTSLCDVRFNTTDAISLVGVSVIELVCYIDDITLFTSIACQVVGSSVTAQAFDLANAHNGWNRLKVTPYAGILTTWETTSSIRIYSNGSANRTIYIDSIRFLRRPKGQIIFIEDGGYTTFLENGQPDLDNLNAPVTWALDPKRLDDGAANITLSEVQGIIGKGNIEFSIHGYDGSATSSMTAAQLQTDTVSGLAWLQKNGILPKNFWRAAFVQNNAPEYRSLIGIVPAMATYNSSAGLTHFPFPNPYNIPRMPLHSRTSEQLDVTFTALEKTHCMAVFYTHGIGDGTYNTTQEQWADFISRITAGITAGWLELTTYNRLMTSEDY